MEQFNGTGLFDYCEENQHQLAITPNLMMQEGGGEIDFEKEIENLNNNGTGIQKNGTTQIEDFMIDGITFNTQETFMSDEEEENKALFEAYPETTVTVEKYPIGNQMNGRQTNMEIQMNDLAMNRGQINIGTTKIKKERLSPELYEPIEQMDYAFEQTLMEYEGPKKKQKINEEDFGGMMMDRSSGSPPPMEVLKQNVPHFEICKKRRKEAEQETELKQKKRKKKKTSHKRTEEEIKSDQARLKQLKEQKMLTEEEKKELKKLRNRETAKLSRDKKKREAREYQHRIGDLERENHKLKQTITRIKKEKEQLEKIIQECPTCTAKNTRTFKPKILYGFIFIIAIIFFQFVIYKPSTTQNMSLQMVPHRPSNTRSILSTSPSISKNKESGVLENVKHKVTTKVELANTITQNIVKPSTLLVDNQIDKRNLPTEIIIESLERDKVLFPEIMKGHFAEQNISSTPPIVGEQDETSKAVVDTTMLSKNKYEEAVIYHGGESNDMTNILFCPFVYPLLPSSKAQNLQEAIKKNQELKIVYPIEVIQGKNDSKLYRISSFKAVPSEAPTTSDSYFSFQDVQKLKKASLQSQFDSQETINVVENRIP